MSIDMYAEKRPNGVWKSCYPVETFQEDGNYPLSSMLLDFDRIASPRGLPDDLSPELRKLVSWQEEKGWNCHYCFVTSRNWGCLAAGILGCCVEQGGVPCRRSISFGSR